ncbi:MAG: hypothetical protein AB1746_09790 [Candidatus Zixiibacteriota bacterium]
MRYKSRILSLIPALVICALLTACEMPLDLDLDFDGYEIIPDGNPIWPDDDYYIPSYSMNILAAASHESTLVAAGSKIVVSNDDSTWSYAFSLYSTTFSDIVWADTMFIAAGSFTKLAYSKDGINWSSNSDIGFHTLVSLAYSGTKVVTTGVKYDYAASRPTAAIFVINDLGVPEIVNSVDSVSYLPKILWNGSEFIAFGNYFSTWTTYSVVLISPDGVTWTRYADSLQPMPADVIWCGDHYLAAFQDTIYSSNDGREWTVVAKLNGIIRKLYQHESTFLAVGTQGHISISTDGISWKQVTFPVMNDLNNAIYFDGLYYVFGFEAIYYTTDFTQWIKCSVM